jgi:hypothetical protein
MAIVTAQVRATPIRAMIAGIMPVSVEPGGAEVGDGFGEGEGVEVCNAAKRVCLPEKKAESQ